MVANLLSNAGANDIVTNGVNGAWPPVRDEVPVLIVGGGPSGLLQAYLLTRFGVRSLIVERYPKRLAAPKAHALSPRSLEICRQFGLDVNHIRSIGSQRQDAYWVNFVTSLQGEHVGKLPYERMDTNVLESTPEMIHNIPQPDFEQIIAGELAKTDLAEIRKGVSFVSSSQKHDEVTTTVEDRETGKTYSIRSRFLIACDGAKSRVRQSLGIESEGEDSYETMMTIHFHANLRPVVGTNIGMLHWLADPEVSGFIIAYDLGGNQALICNFDAEKHPSSSWNEDLCLRILRAAVGKSVDIKVLSWRPWILSRKVANKYRVGSIFLAGDAAHSFPPTGGLGLNCGIADVHNLAYRIAANLQGWGRDSLLDSYEADRLHVAQINSQQSVKNGKKIFALLKALGTTEKDTAVARDRLHESLRDPERRKKIELEINEQQEHFDNLELHIGYVYGSLSYPPNASDYSPKYIAGARLPHTWIIPRNPKLVAGITPADLSYVSELTESDIELRKYSTLDLCAYDAFTLIQGPSAKSAARAAEVLDLLYQHPELQHSQRNSSNGVNISGTHSDAEISPDPLGHTSPLLRTATLSQDFDTLPDTAGDAFCLQAGINEGRSGGLLVRPDQHIQLRIEEETRAIDIVKAIYEHLGLEFS